MKINTFVLAAVAAMTATGAVAQVTAFENQDRAADTVEDIEDQIEDAAERDIGRFGNEGREIGSYGSLSLRGTADTNDGETSTDIGVGLRYGTFDGVNGIDVTASFLYGSDDGVETENQLLIGLDYRRDFSDRFFAYGKADAAFDTLTEEPGEYTQDIFLGAGVGYRIINNAQSQWSIQAGPGYRFAEVVGGDTVEEAAASVSSNYFRSLTETAYITNDTDVIYSDFATTVTNDLAANVQISNAMTLRTSLTTNYNDQTDDSFDDAENILGVSLVYSFN